MNYRIGGGRSAAQRPPLGAPAGSAGAGRSSSARLYDYFLGGNRHTARERGAAAELSAVWPGMPAFVRENRRFLGRAVRFVAEQGIDQFLDLGSGLPTGANVHEVVGQVNPDARVVYTDVDPLTVEHGRELLVDVPNVRFSASDLRLPSSVLTAPEVVENLDFTRPLAVTAVATLPYIADDDEAAAVLNAYRDACPPGSYLVVSHSSPATVTEEQLRCAHSIMRRELTPVRWRTPEQIEALLSGYSLVEPGMVLIPEWCPDIGGAEHRDPAATNTYGAVGYLASASYSL